MKSFQRHALPLLAAWAAWAEPVTASSTVTVAREAGGGSYEAFPDVCRLADGRLFCVYYASYRHVGVPNTEWPLGGKISGSWSSDEGKTWSPPETIFDGPLDDRDPSITQLRDGRLVATFFNTQGSQVIVASSSSGPWGPPAVIAPGIWISSPVRELADGSWIVGAYFQDERQAYGVTLRSPDSGKTWESPSAIDSAGQFLAAETDVIQLKSGELLAALRGERGAPMNFSRSRDGGKSWSKAEPSSFVGHCPYFHRAPGGEILLGYRQPQAGPTRGTALRFSVDEAATWSDAILVDPVIGAYPSMVNLQDGSVLVVYYEEGKTSDIRARKFKIESGSLRWLDF